MDYVNLALLVAMLVLATLEFKEQRRSSVQIRRNLETIMTTLEDFTKAMERLDAATTAIAEKLRETATSISDGMTLDEEEAAVARLNSLADSLEAMAQSVDDPVPLDVPEDPAQA